MGAKTCPGKAKYPHLLSPLRIGNLRLKNRIIASATSPSMITTEGHFTPEMIAYLEEKAKGGAAVVTYGEAIVHSATGKSHNKQLQLDSFGVKQGLAEAARAIHNGGAYASIQLSHGGMYGGLASVGGDEDGCEIAYGPSKCTMPAGEVEEMPKELIYEIVESYGKAAKLVKDCGFDMLQVHAAHGWLFSQFLSPVINQRTDEFGGSLKNRARFLMLALDAVRKAVGPMFPIEIRISGSDMTDRGMSDEECMEVAKMVEDKVDIYNVSCGNHEDPDMFCRTHPSAFFPRGINVQFAAKVKKLAVVEELDPIIETHLATLGIKVDLGKKELGLLGEFSQNRIRAAFGRPLPESDKLDAALPVRPPVLCPGCPHRGLFHVLHKLKVTVSGDIGCYTLGASAPLSAMDSTICMGASIGVMHGFEKVRPEAAKKMVAVIGDSTFMHSGMTGLVNLVYNQGVGVVLILDNSITGMTGHQQNPLTGMTLKEQPTAQLSAEKIAEACGIRRVRVVDPQDLKATEAAIQEELAADEPSVIVVRRPCALLKWVKHKRAFHIDPDKCRSCKACMQIGCPAIVFDGKAAIDPTLCVGCGLCEQLCKFGAICE